MEDAETTTENISGDTSANANTFKITKKTEKANTSWPNPVLSSARSAFDRFLSRSESTEKSTDIKTAALSEGSGKKVKKKRKCKNRDCQL